MDDLTAFLKARLDEDEQVARDADADAWRKAERPSIWVMREGGPVAQTQDFEDAAHIARWDPARVLREVEAKRQIMGLHRRQSELDYDPICDVCCYTPPCETLRTLALPYTDHKDYREEWKL